MAQNIPNESGLPVNPEDEDEFMTTTQICDRYLLDRRVLYRIEKLKWFRKPPRRTEKGQPGNGHKEHLYDREQRQTIRLVMRLRRMGLAETTIAKVLGLPPRDEHEDTDKGPSRETIEKLLAIDLLDLAWRVELVAFLLGRLLRLDRVKPGPMDPVRRTKGPAAQVSPLEEHAWRTMLSQATVRTRRDASKKRRPRQP